MDFNAIVQHALGPLSGLVSVYIGAYVLYRLMEKEREASKVAQKELLDLLKTEINECQSRYDKLSNEYHKIKAQCDAQQREIEDLRQEVKELQADSKASHIIGGIK